MDISWVMYVAFRGRFARLAGFAVAAVLASSAFARAEEPYRFHVVNSRSSALTSGYWNPILSWVAQKSGVPLELRIARTAREAHAISSHGAYHFVYSNHLFTPERDKLGFRVIARAAGSALRGQIIVRTDSAITRLQELAGMEVAFGTPDAFAAYWLPLDALLRAKVNVKAVFTHDQDAALAQLGARTVAAVAVNDSTARDYAQREGFEYRSLWRSEPFSNFAIMASPKLPDAHVAAVRAAFVRMSGDPDGRRILEAGGQLLKSGDALGFVASTDREYDDYRAFYKKTVVQNAN